LANEDIISTSIVVRRQCKELFKLEKAWLSASLTTSGDKIEAAFSLAMKMADGARRYASIPNDRIRP
jgi:hypothetical protein